MTKKVIKTNQKNPSDLFNENIKKPKTLSTERSDVAKRLKRRGVISSPKGISTEELIKLWETYKDVPTIKPVKPMPKQDNYTTVLNILNILVADFKDIFVGWFEDAWRYLPEIEYFWQRIDKEAVNNDPNFIPHEIRITRIGVSDWIVDDQFQMAPEDIIDHLKAEFYDYLL